MSLHENYLTHRYQISYICSKYIEEYSLAYGDVSNSKKSLKL